MHVPLCTGSHLALPARQSLAGMWGFLRPVLYLRVRSVVMVSNTSLVFLEIPTDAPVPGKHLDKRTEEFDVESVALNGGVVVKVKAVSLDPYMRTCEVARSGLVHLIADIARERRWQNAICRSVELQRGLPCWQTCHCICHRRNHQVRE